MHQMLVDIGFDHIFDRRTVPISTATSSKLKEIWKQRGLLSDLMHCAVPRSGVFRREDEGASLVVENQQVELRGFTVHVQTQLSVVKVTSVRPQAGGVVRFADGTQIANPSCDGYNQHSCLQFISRILAKVYSAKLCTRKTSIGISHTTLSENAYHIDLSDTATMMTSSSLFRRVAQSW